MHLTPMRLVLASASPRRAELLRAAGFDFDVCPVDIDERRHPGEAPDAYVRRLAVEKAAGAAARLGSEALAGRALLGADTVVVIDDEILGKPRDAAAMRGMIARLSGRRHEVLTGLSLRCGTRERGTVERSAVFFAPLGTEEIDWYVLMGLASRFVRRVEGSYSNVVGLPVSALYELMKWAAQPGDLP
jgi:septum formation protein